MIKNRLKSDLFNHWRDVLKFLEGEENKTTQRKTQTEVAFVITFRVHCEEQKHKQPTLAAQWIWKKFIIIINHKPDLWLNSWTLPLNF